MARIPEGYGLIPGHSPSKARAALAAAEAAGLDASVVASTAGGYLVPIAVLDKYDEANGAEPEAEPTQPTVVTPDDSWKNADIKQFADDNGIDLGGATTKADMLTAITAAAQDKED